MAAQSGTEHGDAKRTGIRPRVAISMGDPGGIGAEILCKALGNEGLRGLASYRVYGSELAMLAAARAAGIAAFWTRQETSAVGEVVLLDGGVPEEAWRHEPTSTGGAASFRWVECAIADARRTTDDPARVDAIVTAPISKTSWNMAERTRWPGHTELLAEQFGAARSGMLFVGPHLCVMLATIHVPLMRVGEMLTTERVLEAIELGAEGAGRLGNGRAGRGRVRVAVCGLNPHAGEGGILGDEDDAIIAPAVAKARANGIDAHGPLPGDTVFRAAARPPMGKGMYDCVVAMYHDQGLIPVKLVDAEETVNVTVGLPVIRTSPAHGTAFDIAGKNVASAASMRAAIELAVRASESARA